MITERITGEMSMFAKDSIKKPCPRCGCPPKIVEIRNCGPIIRIICPKCNTGISEAEAGVFGIEKLIGYWNNVYANVNSV